MAVFRIEKTRDYTVMSNHHLRNAGLSLKSKGLLSMMLSLPEDWNYTTRGLAKICKEGTDSIGSALKELEQAGYIVRNRLRDSKGKIVDVEYVIYETPHPPDTGHPCEDEPDTACPDTENPDMDNPCLENRPQLNKGERNPEEQNTDSLSTEGSNPIQSSPQTPTGVSRTGRDWMRERESYREVILENIEYDYLCRDDRLDRDMKHKNHYPLDTSAVIHLAARSRRHSNAFRITVSLRDSVCPQTLQEALNRITPRFPSVIAGIHVGLFQYSLVPAKSPPAVRPDTLHHAAYKNFPVTKVEITGRRRSKKRCKPRKRLAALLWRPREDLNLRPHA